jgi:hypothetical protein
MKRNKTFLQSVLAGAIGSLLVNLIMRPPK